MSVIISGESLFWNASKIRIAGNDLLIKTSEGIDVRADSSLSFYSHGEHALKISPGSSMITSNISIHARILDVDVQKTEVIFGSRVFYFLVILSYFSFHDSYRTHHHSGFPVFFFFFFLS